MRFFTGTSVSRLRGVEFAAGRAAFTADLFPANTLFLSVLRSPHPRASIHSIDATEALASPGVVLVMNGAELAAITAPTPSRFAMDRFPGPLDVRSLAETSVRYIGEPVVAVVARTDRDARRAANLIKVEYQLEVPTLDPLLAMNGGAPVHKAWGTNLAARDLIKQGDVEDFCRTAEVVVHGHLLLNGSTSAPIETRTYLGEWDARGKRLTMTGTFQMPHPSRWAIAHALRLAENDVRVVAPNVGGTFGLKMVGHPEEVLVAVLARQIGRPVAFIESRTECFLARAREQHHQFTIGGTSDGRILAFRDRIIADIGVVGAGGGWQMGLVTGTVFPTVYDIPNCEIESNLVTTNKAPWQGVRGYGKEVCNLVMERAIDLFSHAAGLSSFEVRKRNLLQRTDLPHRMPSGMLIDSGDYPAALAQLEKMCPRPAAATGEPGPDSKAIGYGVAFELTPEGASFPGALPGGFETSTVRVDPSGEVIVITSVTSPGGGNETGIAQLVGDVFGLPPMAVRVQQGDTDISPFGAGNTSSRSLMFGGAAAVMAARAVAEKLAHCGAALIGADAADIVFQDGALMSRRDPERSVSFNRAAHAVYTQTFTFGIAVDLPLVSTRSYRAENVRHVADDAGRISAYPSFPYSVHAATVEVCHRTGIVKLLDYAAIHDCGVVVNPALVEGQLRGAVTMGIGAALWEALETASVDRPMADRFKAYLMPRSVDLVPIRVGHRVTPSPFHPLGMKGAGESGVGGALAATANAVADALGSAAGHLTSFPATPPRILAALRRSTP